MGVVVLLASTFLLNAKPSHDRLHKKAVKVSKQFAQKASKSFVYKFKVDSVKVDKRGKELCLYMNPVFTYIPFRLETVNGYKRELKKLLGRRFKNYSVSIKCMGQDIEQLIPNFYRDNGVAVDQSRLSVNNKNIIPLVQNISHSELPSQGLADRTVALWHSHGWYYENKLDRWEWQRARVFTTVEDLWTMEFVVPYLTPMLENAGATVLLPRERDVQVNEVIVDGEGSYPHCDYHEEGQGWEASSQKGFAVKVPFLLEGDNPFEMGGSRRVISSKIGDSFVEYIPAMPQKGEYAVYVCYSPGNDRVSDARYTVYHMGGITKFKVNQRMGGKTWLYLGTFLFDSGKHPQRGKVVLSNESDNSGQWVSADAVRFGGGMGNVARGKAKEISQLQAMRDSLGMAMDSSLWKRFVSGRPRYMEGARYYLQYAGMPDSLVYSINKKSEDYSYRGKDAKKYRMREMGKQDYKDDYMSRGEWVDYLMGTPNGPTKRPQAKGLGIPIDMAFAFHTDAGITSDDGIIGSLAIYSTTRDTSVFPNGQSKWASRDLVDLVQTQVVQDLRRLYEPKWTRRGMWNKQYSEAYRPKVPTMLSEILSHQNFADMYQGMDPHFKFDACRAIYKGILKFLSFQYGNKYVVQPLPVDHFAMEMQGEDLLLSWKPVIDSLEESAVAKSYRVYTRKEDGGFDNGVVVSQSSYRVKNLQSGVIYSFKVTALNEGGESFPSEILACSKAPMGTKPVLVVNGFDRVCAPMGFDNGKLAGFLSAEDEGVAYKRNIAYVGDQYDFDRKSLWLDDDASGHGSSYADQEEQIIPGNSFDYPVVHGRALRDCGLGFISMSDEAFQQLNWSGDDFLALDLIMGEEKTTSRLYGLARTDYSIYTPSMRKAMKRYLDSSSANLILSGAYIGTDLQLCGDTLAKSFAKDVLHFTFRTNHASKKGRVYHPNGVLENFQGEYDFETGFDPVIYKVESPDAIEPSGDNSQVFLRYSGNNKSAGVINQGKYKSVILGFPFETIKKETERNAMMRQIMKFFQRG